MDISRNTVDKISKSVVNFHNKLLQFRKCQILRDHAVITEDLWVRNGKIVDPEKVFFDEKITADVQIDCKGALVAPGFIDLQINGGFGIDFSYNNHDVEAGVQKVAKGLLAHGVTAFCPTLVTSPPYVYLKVLPLLKIRPGGPEGAAILGAHLEGPFINVNKKGAHPAQYIQDMDRGLDSLQDVYGSIENVRIVTLAPELNNAVDIIEELTKRGITVSLGHSLADLSEGERGIQHGATLITHLFNAMPAFHHRDPGLVGLLGSDLINDGHSVFYGIISDGIHTHPAALRIAHSTHPDGLVLVTDAISALGLEEGTHQLGQLAIEVKGGRALVAGTETLCGSIANMNQCIQFFMKAVSCSVVTALEAATLHPAQAVGIHDRKGTLSFGADADFVFLGEDLKVWSTWIAGECVYQDTESPHPTLRLI
ncbi:N-acetylglucosamine-6-phosphate deacetylase isoform X2 [Cryptotermes secundus]|uniref:N-acetylglucosamine-6-phosphate deacetylase isoform X2 n=1 Tax=Cryptotermes secundus TaxID=105785 RepID=UPI000CD7ABE1|nr:N-acetylglucosamine-6-phosphate deacetylase isoform X2 [Cryptotermes secundus]